MYLDALLQAGCIEVRQVVSAFTILWDPRTSLVKANGICGNNEIDNRLKYYYSKSGLSEEFIEWISYEEFKDITHNVVNKETYSALWSKGCICDWNKDKFNWNRKIKKVALVNFEYNIIDFYRVLKEKEQYKLYGISKDPTSHSYILSCKLNHFQLNYGEFPSGNDEIDNILKDHYYDSISPKELIEWIPFNEFREIVLTADNKEIYNALWSKGCIYDWDEDKLSWIREVKKVTLVNFKCSINDFNIMVLKEKLYGISKDPTSHSYILVLDDEGYNQNLLWLKGCICDWDKDKFSWNRKIRKVIAVKFKCGFDTTIKALVEKEGFKIYGISKDSASPNYILRNRMVLTLMEFENLNDLLNYKNKMQINMKKERPEPFKSYIIHGISKNPISLNYILVFEYSQDFLNFLNEPKDYQIIELRNYNNGILKQYSESTSKLGHLKTLYNSELHITKAIEFTELLDCCIEESDSVSTK
ncbi:11783_t:CDS:10 [Rhizophagus irregularis]|nr:11783_t:CDS:10 [Rhizophagus irregularis]